MRRRLSRKRHSRLNQVTRFCPENCVSGFLFWFLFVQYPGRQPRVEMSRGRAASPSSSPRRSMVRESFFISFPQSSLGIRSPNSIANRFNASLQLAIGIVHFLAIRSRANQYSLSSDS